MGINQNHLFEELNGIKCAIVEKNATPARTEFLRRLLEYNRYTVVVVPSPPPKAAAAVPAATAGAPASAAPAPSAAAASSPAGAAGGASAVPAAGTTGAAGAASGETVPAVPPTPAPPPPAPETFTIGVTDVGFNPTNAVFGRLLKTSDGHIVTLAYWQQKAAESHDEIPYFAS
jgi:hypothetical protein